MLSSLLFAIAALHGYWAVRGVGTGAGVPSKDDGTPAMRPGRLAALAVAAALVAAGLILLGRAQSIDTGLPFAVLQVGAWGVALTFAARTIGEFRYVGLFRTVRGTAFATWDARLFTPLCLVLAVGSASIALGPGTLAQVEAAQACALDATPRVLASAGDAHTAGGRIFQVWELDDATVYWTNTVPTAGSYRGFDASLRASGVDVDPVSLLLRKAALPQTSAGDARNDSVVAREAAQWVHRISCLEMLLVGVQNDRIDLLRKPTEFTAFVLRSADGRRLRIYYYTGNEDGIGNVAAILAPAARDVEQGWTLVANLHNHNFRLGQADLNAVVSPSLSDAQLYRSLAAEYQLREAWITNGLHTARIPASAFGRLQTAP
jgi:hypothetical protein